LASWLAPSSTFPFLDTKVAFLNAYGYQHVGIRTV
jgi:hypothetical protein